MDCFLCIAQGEKDKPEVVPLTSPPKGWTAANCKCMF
jgi:hypothetical protein